MLYQSTFSDSKEVVEGGMITAKVALADAKHEISFGQNTMDSMIIDAPDAYVRSFESRS